jgi:hypothetical protein
VPITRPRVIEHARFALNDDRPFFAFTGIWTTYTGDRGTKSKPIPPALTWSRAS